MIAVLGAVPWVAQFRGDCPRWKRATKTEKVRKFGTEVIDEARSVSVSRSPLVDMNLDAVNVSRGWIRENASKGWGVQDFCGNDEMRRCR